MVIILLGGLFAVVGLFVVIFCCRRRERKEERKAAGKAWEGDGTAVLQAELEAHPHCEASRNGVDSVGDSGNPQVFYELSAVRSIRGPTLRPSTSLAMGRVGKIAGRDWEWG